MTIGLPFITKDPPTIWVANLVLLIGCYAGSLAMGEGDPEAEAAGPPVETVPPGLCQDSAPSVHLVAPTAQLAPRDPQRSPSIVDARARPELAFSRPQN